MFLQLHFQKKMKNIYIIKALYKVKMNVNQSSNLNVPINPGMLSGSTSFGQEQSHAGLPGSIRVLPTGSSLGMGALKSTLPYTPQSTVLGRSEVSPRVFSNSTSVNFRPTQPTSGLGGLSSTLGRSGLPSPSGLTGLGGLSSTLGRSGLPSPSGLSSTLGRSGLPSPSGLTGLGGLSSTLGRSGLPSPSGLTGLGGLSREPGFGLPKSTGKLIDNSLDFTTGYNGGMVNFDELDSPTNDRFTLPLPGNNLSNVSSSVQVVQSLPIELLPTQVNSVERMTNILRNYYVAVDESVMGAGKTYMSAYIVQERKPAHLIIISPAGALKAKWQKVCTTHGLPLKSILSYEGLASRKEGLLPHGLLYREKEQGNSRPFFRPSERFIQMAQEGVIIIFDEYAKIKNPTTDNHRASACLVNYICSSYRGITENESRVILLSGTPFDGIPQKIGFLRMIGIIRDPKLHRSDGGMFVLRGANELIMYCNEIDYEETSKVLDNRVINKSTIAEICAMLNDQVILKHISTAAPAAASPEVDFDVKNGYYHLSDNRCLGLNDAISQLQTSVRYRPDGQVNGADTNWAGVTNALVSIEYNKAEVFIRKAIEDLERYPTCKVCIMVSYRVTIRLLTEFLKAYSPIVMEGSMTEKSRVKTIERFQEPNLRYRVLITNLVVGSVGHDLDDQYGDFPRRFYISPGYRAMTLHQATYRPYRATTMSNVSVRLVFGQCGRQETSILDALSRRSGHTIAAIRKQREVSEEVKFPGEYENEDEPPVPQITQYDYQIDGYENAEDDEARANAAEANLDETSQVFRASKNDFINSKIIQGGNDIRRQIAGLPSIIEFGPMGSQSISKSAGLSSILDQSRIQVAAREAEAQAFAQLQAINKPLLNSGMVLPGQRPSLTPTPQIGGLTPSSGLPVAGSTGLLSSIGTHQSISSGDELYHPQFSQSVQLPHKSLLSTSNVTVINPPSISGSPKGQVLISPYPPAGDANIKAFRLPGT
jgi:hypothetical protein